MAEKNLVLKIKSAISEKPTFARVTDEGMTVDSAIHKAIQSLRNNGETLRSKQLEDLYQSHRVFLDGNEISKGDILGDLPSKDTVIKNNEISLIELDLVASHAGGM